MFFLWFLFYISFLNSQVHNWNYDLWASNKQTLFNCFRMCFGSALGVSGTQEIGLMQNEGKMILKHLSVDVYAHRYRYPHFMAVCKGWTPTRNMSKLPVVFNSQQTNYRNAFVDCDASAFVHRAVFKKTICYKNVNSKRPLSAGGRYRYASLDIIYWSRAATRL